MLKYSTYLKREVARAKDALSGAALLLLMQPWPQTLDSSIIQQTLDTRTAKISL